MEDLVRVGVDKEEGEPLYGIMKDGKVEPYGASKWLNFTVDPGKEITEFRRKEEELTEEMRQAIAEYRENNEVLAVFGMSVMDTFLDNGDEEVVEQYRNELEEFAQSGHYSMGVRSYAATILGELE